MSASTWVIVFAKYPTPGRVNTRLSPPLSPQQAAEVQAACLRHVVAHARQRRIDRLVVAAAPDEAAARFGALFAEEVTVWPQGSGDLGARLTRASQRAFGEGAGAVVFLGVDSPTMRWTLLEELPDYLRSADASMGPCADGGYYYLALAGYHPPLLEGIAWGTAEVAAQTRARARAAGLTLHEAEVGYDVDRIADARRALADLDAREPECELAATLRRVLGEAGVWGECQMTNDE